MSDKRPYIPLKVRIKVAVRQLDEIYQAEHALRAVRNQPLRDQLNYLLQRLFGFAASVQLDHDPALKLRKVRRRNGRLVYSPPANSPAHLVYRLKPDHLQKTIGRKASAERTVTTKGSDIWQIKRERKRTRKNRPKRKILSRGFQKGHRPLKGRPFGR